MSRNSQGLFLFSRRRKRILLVFPVLFLLWLIVYRNTSETISLNDPLRVDVFFTPEEGLGTGQSMTEQSYLGKENKGQTVVAYCKTDWAAKGLFHLFRAANGSRQFILKEEPEDAVIFAHSAWGNCGGKYKNATEIYIDMEPNVHRGSTDSITITTVRSSTPSLNSIYLPYALWSFAERLAAQTQDLQRHLSYQEGLSVLKGKTKFAAFAARYCTRDSRMGVVRTNFFDTLSSSYRRVDALGNCRHNTNPPSVVPPLYDNERDRVVNWYLPYKFVLCFENEQLLGYITEKLFNGFFAFAIPIYWGTPDIADLVNKDAIIVCNEDNNTFSSCIEQIKLLDQNDTLWIEKLQQPLFRDDVLPEWLQWEHYSKQLNVLLDDFL
eukprot:jgi/Galph1/923/GphlegSOOS_G5649.1